MLLDILLVLMFAVANIIVLWAGLRIIYVVVFTPWEVNNACQHQNGGYDGNEALFFSRLDKLGDPFEGSVSKINQILRPQWLHDGGVSPEQIPEKIESFSKGKREHISRLLVNCWHENDSESEAMWKLYGGDSGIAVKTTFKGLSECFRCDPDVFIGRIKYIDYNTTPVSESNLFAALLNKRKSFEHEREVRVVSSEMIHEYGGSQCLDHCNPSEIVRRWQNP